MTLRQDIYGLPKTGTTGLKGNNPEHNVIFNDSKQEVSTQKMKKKIITHYGKKTEN